MTGKTQITGHKIVQVWSDGSTTDWRVELTDDKDGVYLIEGENWTNIPPSVWPSLKDAIDDLMGKTEVTP